MSCHTRLAILCLALCGPIVWAAPAWAADAEADLLATLNNKEASLFDKGLACKQLAVVGSEAAVPVLAGLLDDEKLAHYARFGLEPIPSSKVDAALVAALGRLKGRELIGVIDSLGNRGKPEAIGPLSAKLGDADRAVAVAAAHSIARLGTPQGAAVLEKALSAEFAAPCLVGGQTLARQGHTAQAGVLLMKLHALEAAPKYIRLAAMLHAAELQPTQGLELLATALTSSDKDVFSTGLRTARLLKAAGAAPVVLRVLPQAPPARAALLVTLLGDLGDKAGLPAVLQAAAAPDTALRVAALGAFAALGNAEHVKLLIDAAGDPSEPVAAQAQKTLAALGGPAVDRAVLELLDDETRRAVAIRLVGQRRLTAAGPKLLALLDGPNRMEVVAALGEIVTLEQLDALGKLISAEPAELREAARKALHAACGRMPDRDATAARLAAYLPGAAEGSVPFVMDQLRQMGGPKALAIVAQAAGGADAALQDCATQALGEWLDISAAPVLLELAKREGTGKFGVRGMRGYIRLARQFSMPDADRLAMCRTALETAQRDAEKKLVLDVLERYPSVAALRLVVETSKVAALKGDAARTALAMSEKLNRKSAEVQGLLAQLGHEPVKIEIIRAEYGAGGKVKDVTATLRQHVRDFPLIVLPKDRYNAVFGGDPAPGTHKQLKVQYRIDGKPGEVSFVENAPILLPMPK